MGESMRQHIKTLLLLHMLLLLYSISSIFSKLAAAENFLSTRFIIFYGLVIGLLGIYAVAWQQIIKRLPLTAAYANKAVTVVWGILWGALFFHESITIGKVVGGVFVMVGIILFPPYEKGDAP